MSLGTKLQTKDPARIVAEKRYAWAINGTGSATVIGHLLCWTSTTTGAGKTAIQPVSANLSSFAGVCLEAVADGEVVRMQTCGYNDTVSMLGHASLSEGDVMVPVNTADHAVYASAATGAPAFIICCEAYTTTSAAADKAALLYCGY